MKTKLKYIHNEEIQHSDTKKSIGVLLNYSIDESNEWNECLIYTFNHKTQIYVFFFTIFDMINFTYYGTQNVKCALLPENEFDNIYDSNYINGKFSELLEWT